MKPEIIDWRSAAEFGLGLMLQNGTRPAELGPRHIEKYIVSVVDYDFDLFDAELVQWCKDIYQAFENQEMK